eukprot:gene498-531_t
MTRQYYISEYYPNSRKVQTMEEFLTGCSSIDGVDKAYQRLQQSPSYEDFKEIVERAEIPDVHYADGADIFIVIKKCGRIHNVFTMTCYLAPHEGGPGLERSFLISSDKNILLQELE